MRVFDVIAAIAGVHWNNVNGTANAANNHRRIGHSRHATNGTAMISPNRPMLPPIGVGRTKLTAVARMYSSAAARIARSRFGTRNQIAAQAPTSNRKSGAGYG